jgi:predicted RNase H-like nuclease
MRTRVAGVDGCPAGWLRIERLRSGALDAQVLSTGALVADAHEFTCLAIDIPIGLPDTGARTADRRARAVLGAGRSSSVFPAPVRAVLPARSYEEACDRSFAATGQRLSRQAFNILPKIRDVDAALAADPSLVAHVHEVHPEVSFCYLAGGRPMQHSKKTMEGRRERLALLYGQFGDAFDAVRANFKRADVSSDDIADALVVLWSAERIVGGTDIALVDAPDRDALGVPMQIRA